MITGWMTHIFPREWKNESQVSFKDLSWPLNMDGVGGGGGKKVGEAVQTPWKSLLSNSP